MNRGVNRSPIFSDDEDRIYFSQLVVEHKALCGARVYHWEWMGNHYPDHARTIRDRWLQRLKAEPGRVWECMDWGGEANQNSGFAPSITLPLGVLCQ
jgi:hypothetical protein